MNKLFKILSTTVLGVALAVGVGVGVAQSGKANEVGASTTTTYTFTSKSWADSTNSFTSDKDGLQMSSSPSAVQVNSVLSGAGATSKSTFQGITSIKIEAATTSKGVGNVNVKVGDGTSQQICSLSKNTTMKSYELTYSSVSGKISFVVNCSANSMYVKSITVTCSNAVATDLTVNPTGDITIDGNNEVYTKTSTLSYSVSYEGEAGDGLVTVSISPNTGLTYSDDEKGTITLTGKVNGSYTVTISTVDKNASGNVITVNKSVTVQNLLELAKPIIVTSINDLQIADTIYFVNTAYSKASSNLNSNYFECTDVTIEDGYMTSYDGAKSFVVGKQLAYWTFKADEGLMGMGTGKNSMSLGDSTATTQKFSLSINSDNSNAAVESSVTSGLTLQFNPSTRFSNYTSSQSVIQIYAIHATDSEVAAEFEQNYLIMSKTDEGQCLTYYPNAKSVYNGLTAGQKSKISTEGMARLQAWAAANGDTIDGSGNIVSGNMNSLIGFNDNNMSIVIIVVVSVISLTTIGGYFFIRRRKENH